MHLECSNLAQTKQSHKHGLCKAAGAPRLPSVQPGECTLQGAALPCVSAHTNAHRKLLRKVWGSPVRWRGRAWATPSSERNLIRVAPAWKRQQPGDKPEAKVVRAPCGKGEGGAPATSLVHIPAKAPQLHPHLPGRQLHDAEGTSILPRWRR